MITLYRSLLWVAVFVLAFSFLPTVSGQEKSLYSSESPVAKAAPSPSFTTRNNARTLMKVTVLPLVTQDGKAVDLLAQGGWKVISFWSPSCPCVQACQTYSLVPLWRHYQAGKKKAIVQFYAVASNAANLEYPTEQEKPVRLFLPGSPDQTLPYPLLLDSHHKVADLLGAITTPETFLISPTGQVVFRGDPDNSAQRRKENGVEGAIRHYLADALQQALLGKAVRHNLAPVFGCTIDRTDTTP